MSEPVSREDIRKAYIIANALSTVRRNLAASLGDSSYQGKRQYNLILGYPDEISQEQYQNRYQRQDIAGRIIDLPAIDTWKLAPIITDGNNDGTAFLTELDWLIENRRLWSAITRADRISGIGRFGGIFIGVKDGREPSEETAKVSGPEGILFLRPFSESSCEIAEFDMNPQSERFGLPSLYRLTVENNSKILIHWSRILHLADNRVESDWEGMPRLQRVWNRLDDLYKVVGGSAESNWLNMRPGTVITTQKDYDMNLEDEAVRSGIENEIQEYVHGVMRFLTLEGVDVKQLQGQILDPKGPFDVEIALISAASGIPQRVLLGSAAGELAAAEEDTKQWYGAIQARQTNYAEPDILRPAIDRFISLGAISAPTSGGYEVEWQPLFESSDAELATTAKTWAEAINTMGVEVSNKEKREKLGMPIEIPKDMMDPEPEKPEPQAPPIPGLVPTPEELDGMPTEELIVQAALSNLRAGLVTNEGYIELLEGLLEDARATGSE